MDEELPVEKPQPMRFEEFKSQRSIQQVRHEQDERNPDCCQLYLKLF